MPVVMAKARARVAAVVVTAITLLSDVEIARTWQGHL
jgi:hypothetical protein